MEGTVALVSMRVRFYISKPRRQSVHRAAEDQLRGGGPRWIIGRVVVDEKLRDFRPIENTTLNTAGEESFITFAR